MRAQISIPVTEKSQVGEARRAAAVLAARIELDETEQGRVALVATELATNLARHAKDGLLLLRSLTTGRGRGLELLALDRGPGMQDVHRCMQDGFSTAGSPGSGLGAVRRLSTEFDIHSTPPAGTVVLARLFSSSHDGPEPDALAIGAVCLPAPGETESGDTWRMAEREGSATFMVADGLGHGPLAAQAAAQAAAIFEAEELSGPRAYLEKAHGVLRGGRGAAIAAARLDICTGTLRYAGIGNIAGSLIASGESRGLVSLNGTIGVQLHKVQDFDYDWPPGGLLVMHSDGLSTRWNLKGDPALSSRHPAVIAGALYRDFSRGRDDVTVFVARLKRPNGQSERG